MAESQGVDRKTLRNYIAPAEAAGIAPVGPAKSDAEYYDDLAGRLYGLLIVLEDRLGGEQAQLLRHFIEVGEYGLALEEIAGALAQERTAGGLDVSPSVARPACGSFRIHGETWHAGQVSYEQPPRGRMARLFEAADRHHVPLRTILVTVGVVVATYLAGQLIYRLRDIVLLMLVAGFTAMLLHPAVARVQRRVPRRGLAVTIVTLWAALVFLGLAAAFGVPLVNGVTHLAGLLPGYVASAQHGNGWIGHLVARYHVQAWVQRNTPKLAGYAQSLGKRPDRRQGRGLPDHRAVHDLRPGAAAAARGPEDVELDSRPDEPGPRGHGHPDSGRRQPEGHRVHGR